MSKLVIVESPAKAKTIGKYLGADYVVKASMGHLRDLPKKKMSIDLEHDFKPEYVPIEGKDKVIKEIRSEIRKADFVYLATDPDREGEAISWHIKELFKLKDSNSRRVTFNEITKQAVRSGIASPRDIDIDLVNAQQARRILDRIVGYQLSPFLWRKVKRGLSAGRVQSVATRLVVDRENEIRAFVPEEYWSIEALLATEDGGTFTARYYGDGSGKAELKNEEQAMRVVNAVTGKPFTVGEIKRGKKKRTPAPPFITSTLQQEASRKLNMTPRRTMSIAQELYEGIELGEYGLTGLITYMRTDSLRLADEATAAAAGFIKGRYGEDYYPGKPRVYKTKSGAQDAHEAIRPSNVQLLPEEIRKYLSPDQFKLYRLIWSRFVACQMADAILDTVSADIVCEGQVFRASGHTVAFPGFTAVYEEGTDDEKKQDAAGKPLPRFDKGDRLTAEKLEPSQHFTQPPARYTEASLIRAMEERGIGRPSTYAPTISTIIDRDYVTKESRALRPTPLGEGVTGLLVDEFKSVADYEFTANMEHELDEVEAGRLNYIQLLHNFYDGFEAALKQAESDLEGKRIKIQDEVTDVICEKCGRNMVIKSGRFGKFLACPGFPECTNTKPITEDTGAACPVCGAKVVKKKSARGYVYYSCDTYPTCQFMTWDKPLKTKCPNCDSSLFRHTDRDYVTKENKALRPTPLGEGVTGLLVDEFKSVADYEFTANMEHELDEVEAGKLNYIQLLHNFYDGFEAALKQAEIDLEGKRIKIQDEVTDVICDKCGRNMVIKSGRFGKFLACPGFPECTNTKPITEDTGAACPVCGAKVVKKKSARGFVYYSCDKYPACQFITWDKPLKTKCPNCDSSLFRHTDRDSKEVTDVCLREGCGFVELVKEGLPPEETEKRRKMREARAAKAAERAAAKEAAEKNGETAEKAPKETKKPAAKKKTVKKTLPWMTKTTNRFKKLKDEAVQELTAKQQEQYAKALAKYEAEKAAEKAKKAAEKKAAAKKPAARKKTTAKENPDE